MNLRGLRQLYVRLIWADTSFRTAVRANLHAVVSRIRPGQTGLNFGAGFTRLHPQIRNVEFALVLYPIKWLDVLFAASLERDRIPGGYLVITRKA